MKRKTLIAVLVLMVSLLPLAAQTELAPVENPQGFNSVEIDGFSFLWKIEDGIIEYEISAPTRGWVAIGFKPSRMMKDADYTLGYVDGGEVMFSDDFGVSTISHRADTRLGGENNLELVMGREENDRTSIRVRKPLVTGDENDQALTEGELTNIIFAWGPNRADNFTTGHTRRGSFRVRL